MDSPKIQRVRFELKRRRLTVREVQRLTPKIVRVTFTGEDLADFKSLGFDDHVKLFFTDEAQQVAMRDFTPRRYDTDRRERVCSGLAQC